MDDEKRQYPDEESPDGGVESSGEERNILREKTFNEELRGLVNRITDNEERENYPCTEYTEGFSLIDWFRKQDVSTQDRLFLALHRLFYATKYQASGTRFWTGTMDRGGIPLNSDFLLEAAFQTAGYPDFALLSYDIHNHSFRVMAGTLMNDLMERCHIHLKDPFFRQLKNEDISLARDEISEDDYLSERFLHLLQSEEQVVYLTLFSRVLAGVNDQMAGNLGYVPSLLPEDGILVIRTDREMKHISERLRKTVAWFLLSWIGSKEKLIEHEGRVDVVDKLEHILSLAESKGDTKGYMVFEPEFIKPEVQALFSYMVSRITSMLGRESKILQLGMDALCVLTGSEKGEKLGNLVREMNEFSGLNFTLEEYPIEEIRRTQRLLRRYFN